ncbi:outer envelope pore protein 37, chloroplastic [Argentina anserina]|uniref:outer envelope pore protein 37, chloroplastic n=1 Tax=Argentina anserina TaxID=57926 RepID=UPI00217660A5|nr:outer envelope pore protein 37, chloroplastic [Potentilla anserina]
MADSSAPPPPALPNPNYPADSLPPPPARFFKRPSVRVTSEFDSDSSVFFHKVSCKLLDSVAKLKVSFSNDHKGEVVSPPQVSFISQYLSIHYNFEDESTILNSSVDVGPRLQFRASHDLKARQGEASMLAKFPDPGYALQLSSTFPSAGLPKATLKFPLGEVSFVEKEEEEQINRAYSMSGTVKGQIFNGLGTAYFAEDDIKLRYSFKDEEMSFIPSISLPSNALSFAFKRRFGPSDKLSYWYNFDSNYWSAVYKHTYGRDLKLKAGYDSEVRLGWASLWVGDEAGKAKTAPLKMKVQFMLQVPQDDIRSSALMFRVKKRWDI